jgi:hypothetical protein
MVAEFTRPFLLLRYLVNSNFAEAIEDGVAFLAEFGVPGGEFHIVLQTSK